VWFNLTGPMTPAPKRRWFRFSLRTLFVVVTLFGCWLGYNLNWIRARRNVLDSGEAGLVDWGPYSARNNHSPPWPLGWFGEQSPRTAGLVLTPSASDADLARVQSLFPEMRVTRHSAIFHYYHYSTPVPNAN
jgi:hypothetical protein